MLSVFFRLFMKERKILMKKTSLLNNGLIWFGAGVSVSEIFTGTLLASLGFKRGIAAIILGHMIGCVLMFFAGFAGAKNNRSAMDAVKMSFGKKGAEFFAFLNVIQLSGWTAVMIVQGATATNAISGKVFGFDMTDIWCVIIGLMIVAWIIFDLKKIDKINTAVMSLLFILTLILSYKVFLNTATRFTGKDISFWAATELSAAMPISWLPVISDYTKDAKKPFAATIISVLVYFATSSWMYILGMAAAIFTSCSDISQIILTSGLGVAGMAILLLSTVTTAFLDAYSAGVSVRSLNSRVNVKFCAAAVAVIGIILAVFTPIEQFENFLYIISSVFVPMITIQIVDLFILKKEYGDNIINSKNFIIWIIGFIIYRLLMKADTFFGYTLPTVIVVGIICLVSSLMKREKKMKLDNKEMMLYAVTDRAYMTEDLKEDIKKAAEGGITLLQLREKNLDEDKFLKEALEIKELLKEYKIKLIINDNVNVAKLCNADGIHIGQEDAGAAQVRKILGKNKIIGVSVHNLEEALRAQESGADYLGVGAMFYTNTKPDAETVSVEELKRICENVKIPVVIIGGISAENIMEFKGTGIAGAAVSSAIFKEKDIKQAATELLGAVEKIM